jgi:carboxyl-terminal processing protease
MNSKPLIIITGVIAAVILLTGSCAAGIIIGQTVNRNPVDTLLQSHPLVGQGMLQPDIGGTPADLEDLFQPFWQTWNLVDEEFVEQPVDKDAMMRGAINGMLESLDDEHTSYLDPDMFERANAQLDGEEYEGIGAWVDISGDYLTIISPMPGSPAEDAGLKPNDKVIGIDGEDMIGIDGELVRQRILGPEGTIVRMTILRDGVDEPLEFEIERASIIVPTVESRMLEENIAYVHLYTFGDDTASDMRNHLEELLAQNPEGLILDLRFNGGGYLDTAISVVSEYISDGVVMIEEFGDGRRETYEAKSGGVATGIPLVILINEGSASASEIVAGAVQDTGRGVLVGTTSFGKGSVQNYTPLVNNQGAVRVTIAKWLTPNGRHISGVGLEPDYVVEITEQDIQQGLDPQLTKAIELLLNR